MDGAEEEHHVVKILIVEIAQMEPDDEHYDAKFKVLAETVRHHEGTTLELLPDLAFDEATVNLLTDFSLAGQRPVNWNVLSVAGSSPAARVFVERMLSASDHARAKGADVRALIFVSSPAVRINFWSGFIFDAIPGWDALFRMSPEDRLAKLKDPAFREKLAEGARSPVMKRRLHLVEWAMYRLVEVQNPDLKRYQGRLIGEIAIERGQSSLNTLLDLAVEDNLKASYQPYVPGEDADTYKYRGELWQDDRTVIGASDAGAHMDMVDAFAFSTKLLQKGVREYGVIGLEEAVRQLTEVPAQLFGRKERGNLREGWQADIVVFDPATVGHGAVYTRYDLPGDEGRLYADAVGVSHVIVNGQVIVEHGKHSGQLPGKVLRSGQDTYTVRIPAAESAAPVQ